jgi:predicted small secreted protein
MNASVKRLIAIALLSAFAVILSGCHSTRRGGIKPVSSAAPAHATDSKNA